MNSDRKKKQTITTIFTKGRFEEFNERNRSDEFGKEGKRGARGTVPGVMSHVRLNTR